MAMFLPGCAFKVRTSSTTLLLIKVELRQAVAVVSVVETTYFGMVYMTSPKGPPAGGASNAPPWICHVLRPRSSASLWLMASKKCAPMSSCQNGHVHPPWVKPPSVSSSAPPGACMTLSNDTNSDTTMFRMIISVSNNNSRLSIVELTLRSQTVRFGVERTHIAGQMRKSTSDEIVNGSLSLVDF